MLSQPAQRGSDHPFACNTCHVAFSSAETQRAHVRSDWHRYNLKRRVASLSPISLDVFTEKVLAKKATAAAAVADASFEKFCDACQKNFYSHNAFQNHVNSQKHKANLAKVNKSREKGDDGPRSTAVSDLQLRVPDEQKSNVILHTQGSVEVPDVVQNMNGTAILENESSLCPFSATSKFKQPVPKDKLPLQCLFCNFYSSTFEFNIVHMDRCHGMFIPEREYLTSSEGLISYLHGKIQNAPHTCLFCGKTKRTAMAVQSHMIDMSHCMIPFTSDSEMLEYGQFYDFRATYSEDLRSDSDSVGGSTCCSDSQDPIENEDMYKDPSAAGDDGWETCSSCSEIAEDEVLNTVIGQHHTPYRQRPCELGALDDFYDDGVQLHLPSGIVVGHRSLKVYWKQNLRRFAGPGETGMKGDSQHASTQVLKVRKGEKGIQVSRRNGELGMLGISEAGKKEVRHEEWRERKRDRRIKEKYQAGNERRGNFQKHFRDHLLQ